MKKILRVFIYLCLFSILLYGFIYLGKKDYSSKVTDAEKFNKEYSFIPVNNPFVYVKSYEVLDIIENKSGIILMGYSSNSWMQAYVKELYNVIKDSNIKKIYYYDLQEDRARKSKNFVMIEDALSSYLKRTDKGDEYLFTPALIFVYDGKIINYDDETSLVPYNMTIEEYWNYYKKDEFANKIRIYLSEYDYSQI